MLLFPNPSSSFRGMDYPLNAQWTDAFPLHDRNQELHAPHERDL
jgi:hypothetical protein